MSNEGYYRIAIGDISLIEWQKKLSKYLCLRKRDTEGYIFEFPEKETNIGFVSTQIAIQIKNQKC